MVFDYDFLDGYSSLKDKFFSYLGKEEEVSEDAKYDHLDGLRDGCGCVETWEALIEERSELSPEELEE